VLLVPGAAAALIGSRCDEAALDACAAAARAASRPITDRRGTAEFRRQVIGVLVRRAVLLAVRRAGGGA
jgi:carbon-monoxide dehydrogenase medium subunit